MARSISSDWSPIAARPQWRKYHLMAAALGLAPIVTEKTSNNPMIRQYYGQPVVDLPQPQTLLQYAFKVCSCTSRDEGKREVPLKTSSMPTPTSPRSRSVEASK